MAPPSEAIALCVHDPLARRREVTAPMVLPQGITTSIMIPKAPRLDIPVFLHDRHTFHEANVVVIPPMSPPQTVAIAAE